MTLEDGVKFFGCLYIINEDISEIIRESEDKIPAFIQLYFPQSNQYHYLFYSLQRIQYLPTLIGKRPDSELISITKNEHRQPFAFILGDQNAFSAFNSIDNSLYYKLQYSLNANEIAFHDQCLNFIFQQFYFNIKSDYRKQFNIIKFNFDSNDQHVFYQLKILGLSYININTPIDVVRKTIFELFSKSTLQKNKEYFDNNIIPLPIHLDTALDDDDFISYSCIHDFIIVTFLSYADYVSVSNNIHFFINSTFPNSIIQVVRYCSPAIERLYFQNNSICIEKSKILKFSSLHRDLDSMDDLYEIIDLGKYLWIAFTSPPEDLFNITKFDAYSIVSYALSGFPSSLSTKAIFNIFKPFGCISVSRDDNESKSPFILKFLNKNAYETVPPKLKSLMTHIYGSLDAQVQDRE